MAPKAAPETAAASNIVSTDDEGWETLVEEYGETWNPDEVGAVLIGTFTGRKTVETKGLDGEDRQVDVYEVIDSNKKKWSVWSSYNLDLAFENCRPSDLVRIEFMGTVPLDGGRSVKTYRVARKSQ